jgi:hypothetical protein
MASRMASVSADRSVPRGRHWRSRPALRLVWPLPRLCARSTSRRRSMVTTLTVTVDQRSAHRVCRVGPAAPARPHGRPVRPGSTLSCTTWDMAATLGTRYDPPADVAEAMLQMATAIPDDDRRDQPEVVFVHDLTGDGGAWDQTIALLGARPERTRRDALTPASVNRRVAEPRLLAAHPVAVGVDVSQRLIYMSVAGPVGRWGVSSPAQPTKEGNRRGWVVVLCVVAILFIVSALIRARTRYRRGSHNGPPELPGQWEAEHRGYIEGQEFRGHGDTPFG